VKPILFVKPIMLLSLLLLAAVVRANPAAHANAGDELSQNLYPPELVVKFRQDIGLDDRQSKALKELVQQAQSHFLDLQWDLQTETGKLARLLRAPRVDETAAIGQVERVLGEEQEVKKAQLTLLIRIKNLLTVEQQQKLSALRASSP
jgi:Spy/CpxP family protein refolding chaperone